MTTQASQKHVSLFICITMAFLLFVSESPFQMGVLVLGLSTVSAIIVSAVTTWLALILFLMYVGGMLVTFAYFLALCPNQMIGWSVGMLVPFLFGGIMSQELMVSALASGVEVCSIYEGQNIVIFIILGLVLFFAMVSVVKVVSRPSGALRPLGSSGESQ